VDGDLNAMVLGVFAQGFITGSGVTVALFLLIFGLAFWLRRRQTRGLTLSSENYAQVLDQRGIEMAPARVVSTSTSPLGRRSSTFVISDDERDDMSHLELESNPELTPQEFESKWLSFQARENLNFTLTFGDADVEEILASQRIKCMAAGAAGDRQKYYFFGREAVTGALFLMEVFVLARDRELAAEIRCASSVLLPDLVVYMKQAMKAFAKAAII
jgi:hypothetical protein